MRFIGVIQTKSSISFGKYDKDTHYYGFAKYEWELHKWEIPIWFWRIIIQTIQTVWTLIYLVDADREKKSKLVTYGMSPTWRESILNYINCWDFDLVWYEKWVWVVYQWYFRTTTSWGQRYFDPIPNSEFEKIEKEIRYR